MSRRNHDFQTIRSEGGLLPPDLLRRVLDPKAKLDGTGPEDYGLPQGERLNEVITQSWNRLRRHWAEFRTAAEGLPEGEAGTGLTNEKWNLPLLRELGFGLLPTTAGPEVGGRSYAISRFFGPVPVHLVGCGLSLDRRAAGQRGAAAANPHGLVQEFINRSPGHMWAIVSNGLRLRVLRDSQALSRQSFLEFDLEAMFVGEVYSDFVLFWLMDHATRFAPRESGRPETCWLEQWTKEAQEQGTRALGDLRGGVERALQILGEGFTSHPKNSALRDALRTGQVPLTDFQGQLLRVVYRLLFLFVAEDRTLDGQPLLHPHDDSEAARTARERYAAHYSSARLRELASRIRGSRHGDLWRQFQLLVGALSGDPDSAAVRAHLALPALGSFLWDPAFTAVLNDAELTNHDFLDALRNLAFTRQGKVLRPVDYKNLGSEEFGGVYESFLGLTPQLSADGARFSFAEFAGSERKTSGSYYTPDSLVQCLLDSALDPVVEERLADAERLARADWPAVEAETQADSTKLGYVSTFLIKRANVSASASAEEMKRAWGSISPVLRRWQLSEEALLALEVCDPAVGSGHFLVGAGHRLARHLARVRALAQGESEPSPLLYQTALRDVISHCLCGVDINPMAVELCKVTLWLEAMEPGKPLSFLDHHIRVGNSLLGTTPELIAAGLPDEAFTAIEGDDKKVCASLKKRNKQEREGQQDMLHLMVADSSMEYGSIATRTRGIDQAPDNTIGDVQHKADQFRHLLVSPQYRHAQQVADTWSAAFVWEKQSRAPFEAVTTDTVRRLEADPEALAPAQRGEVERIARKYQFFHWHLAFPEVFANGGFDCVLGNPPWVRQETLASIKRLLPTFESFASTADSSVYFIERSLKTTRLGGRVALLTPNKWFRASYAGGLRTFLRQRSRMDLLIDFGHSRTLFPDADTFPAAVTFRPVVSPVTDREPARFVQAHDPDREHYTLPELIRTKAIVVAHRDLRPDRWHLEGAEVSDLLNRLMATGQPLEFLLPRPILSGLKTGFNEAFYVEAPLRGAMLAEDPNAEPLFKKFLRGRDVKRWAPLWDQQWHIVIPSSQNRNWPWSSAGNEAQAEAIFAITHPSIYAHLKQFQQPLQARQDKGTYWWELRSCDYYGDFEQPKIIVQCIAYYSQFAFDDQAYYVNNKVIAIPTADLYLLAILNSRIVWWIVNRTFQHMKDEGLSVDVQFLKRLPVPMAPQALRIDISRFASALIAAVSSSVENHDVGALETRLNELVERAFGLTDAERRVLLSSLPPRDPIAVIE
jgi:hypothetical protein